MLKIAAFEVRRDEIEDFKKAAEKYNVDVNVALILALSCAACALRFLFLRARTPDGGFERSSGS